MTMTSGIISRNRRTQVSKPLKTFEDMQEALRKERKFAILFMAFSIVLAVGFAAAVLSRF